MIDCFLYCVLNLYMIVCSEQQAGIQTQFPNTNIKHKNNRLFVYSLSDLMIQIQSIAYYWKNIYSTYESVFSDTLAVSILMKPAAFMNTFGPIRQNVTSLVRLSSRFSFCFNNFSKWPAFRGPSPHTNCNSPAVCGNSRHRLMSTPTWKQLWFMTIINKLAFFDA